MVVLCCYLCYKYCDLFLNTEAVGHKLHIQFTGDELCGSRAYGMSGKWKTVWSLSVYVG